MPDTSFKNQPENIILHNVSPQPTTSTLKQLNPDSNMKTQEKTIATPDSIEIDYESLPENASVIAHLSAGAFAGIMEHTVMFPIDSLKTRMQIAKNASVYKGILSSVSKISATEGARSLWRGVSSVVVGAGPAHAVYFSVFETTKTFLVKRLTNSNSNSIITDENHPLIASFSGIAATTTSDALMTPFDVLKQRMQAHSSINQGLQETNSSRATVSSTTTEAKSATASQVKNKSTTLLNIAKTMYKTEGFSAFYISYPTTLSLNIPFAALNFGVYEYSSSLLNPDHLYNPLSHCIAGGISGGVAAAITNPLDCIKTALQTKGISSDQKIRNIRGFKDAVIVLWQQDGYRAFLRGLRPRIVFNVPSTAISWTAYEMAKAYLIKGHT